jgi:putative DNA primase/helicase
MNSTATERPHKSEAGGGGEKPTALPLISGNIPADLKDLPHWVVWRYVEEVDQDTGEVDFTKPPLNAQTLGLASSTNPKTWSPFAVAAATYQSGGLDGLGFVLAGGTDGTPHIVAIDLDHCRDRDTGAVESRAQHIVATINSYTEVSPSGTGIRIFLRGALPPSGRKKGTYENYETGRYVTVTGQHIKGTPLAIEHRQPELEQVHRQVFGEAAAGKGGEAARPAEGALDLADAEIIRRAGAARGDSGAKFKRLWEGDTGGYTTHSEADLALCNYLGFWCGPDEDRIADLFAQSGLMRSKWQREDYRRRTIEKALAGRTEFYRGPGGGQEDGQRRSGPKATNGGPFHLTDWGRAQRVVDRHGGDLRYCHPWKQWLVWDGRRWRPDVTAEVERRVKETITDLYQRTGEEIKRFGDVDDEDEERQAKLAALRKLLGHCLDWEKTRSITSCLESMKSEPGVPVQPDQLDTDPFLLNVLNGTLDLRTGQLRPHQREDLITKLAPVEYDPAALCPTWDRFLRRIMNDDQDLLDYLQRVVGYSLTGDVSEQCLFFFHGTGRNGKSTFLGTVLALLGDYGKQAVSELLTVRSSEQHPTERADLFGKRLVATIETEEGKRMAEALMKQLTGGDKINARRMRENFWDFTPTHKIFLAANHKPTVRGTDCAVWRRIKLVPFTVTITEEEKDKDLPAKLRDELPGILAWAVRGCLAWQQHHSLGEPEQVKQATDAYQVEMDTVQRFINECCLVHKEVRVKVSALFDAYVAWSGDRLTTQPAFNDRLRSKGFETTDRTKHGFFWLGIGLPEGSG